MSAKTIIPLVLALVVGLVTVRFGRQLIAGRAAVAVADAGPTGPVLVVTGDLEVGRTLKPENVQLVQAPLPLVPSLALKELKAAHGRVMAVPLAKGQILAETALAPVGTLGGLQAAVPAGKRAVTVEVNEVSGLSGMIVPGARVDIVATLTDDQTRDTVTRAIVQNVPVTAVGTRMNKEGAGDVRDAANGVTVKTVTLIVTPEQAASLDLAYTRSRPRLVLRNAGEGDSSTFKPVTLSQLVRGASEEDRGRPSVTQMLLAMAAQQAQRRQQQEAAAAQPATQPAAAPRRSVEVIRAGVPSTTLMDESPPAPVAQQPAGTTPPVPSAATGLFESSDAR